jgi:ribosomal silencing factor RsfS
MKHVQVVQLGELGYNAERFAIVSSGFSGRHIYSTAKKLAQLVKAVECPLIVNQPKVMGRKDDSWLLVSVKDVQVHMIVDDYRYDLDLEFRWLNPPPPDMIAAYKMYNKLKKKSDGVPFDDAWTKEHEEGMK